jgi:hypothetical protein
VVDTIDYIYRKMLNKHGNYRSLMGTSKEKDSFCCDIFNVDDEHEIIFSKHDIEYVLELLAYKDDLIVKKNLKKTNTYQFSIGKIEYKNLGTKFKILDKILTSKFYNLRFFRVIFK